MARLDVPKWISRFAALATVMFFLLTAVCMVLQIFFRYVLGVAMPWTEELARYSAVWLTVFGLVWVTREKQHLGVYFLRDAVPGRWRRALSVITNVVSLVVMAVVVAGALQMVRLSWNVRAVTMPGVRVGYLYLALIIGSCLTAFYLICETIWPERR